MGKAMDLFKEILCGDLDNRQQVANERALGKQVHPYAKHITRICDHRVKHRPEGHQGNPWLARLRQGRRLRWHAVRYDL